MQAKLESASREWPRGVPRWVFEAWLWASVLAAALSGSGCPMQRFAGVCTHFSNTVGVAFELFPGTLAFAFLKVAGSPPVVIGCVALCAVVCHWIARKILPTRLSWRGAAILVVAWVAVSLVTEFLSVWVFFDRPPLLGMLAAV